MAEFQYGVVTLKVHRRGGLRRGIAALWCWRLEQGEKVKINEITDQFVE